MQEPVSSVLKRLKSHVNGVFIRFEFPVVNICDVDDVVVDVVVFSEFMVDDADDAVVIVIFEVVFEVVGSENILIDVVIIGVGVVSGIPFVISVIDV